MARTVTTAALLLAATVLGAASAAAQDHDHGPDTVRMSFAWPDGAAAAVHATRSRERTQNGVSSLARSALDYRLTLERSDSGYLVRYSDFRGAAPEGEAHAPEIAAHLAGFTPSYFISRDGEFRGVHDMAAVRAMVDSLTAPLQAEVAEQPGAAELLANLTSDEMLRSSAEQDWNVLVGTWAGAEFVVGSVYGSRVVERFPLFGGVDLPMEYDFTAVQRVPCDSADTGVSCVALQMTSRPDPDVVRRVVTEMLSRVMPSDSDMLSRASFDVLNTVHLVARPGSLLPYRVAVTRETSLTLPEEGRMSEYREMDVREKRFLWDSRVSRPASTPGSPAAQ